MNYKNLFNFLKANTALILAVLFVTVLFPLVFKDNILRLFHDDSFFYIKTAYNNSIGIFSSFDTVNKTSGYHPLYMILLSAVSFFLPLTGLSGVVIVFSLDMVIFLVFLLIVSKIMDIFKFSTSSKIIIFLLLICSLAFNDFGMEARLLLPLYWLLVFLLINNYRNYFILGLVSALIFLTRIDSIIFIFFIGLFLLWENWPIDKRRIKYLSFFILPIAVAFVSYFLINFLYFNHLSSVSSWLKFGFLGFGYPIIHGFLGVQARFLVCFLSSILFSVYFLRSILNKKFVSQELLFFLINLSSILFLIVIANLSRSGLASWYFSLPISISIITAGYLLGSFFSDKKINFLRLVRLLKNLFILCLLAILLIFLNRKLNYHYQDDAVGISHWIGQNFDKNKNIFQVDNSGFTGYLSNRNIINGDGLINSWEYQSYLRSNDLIGYFKKYSIRYIIWDKYNDEKQIKVPVMFWDRPDEYIFLDDFKIIKRLGRFVLLEFDYNNIKLLK